MNASALYIGSVVHQRLRPVRHRLRSAIFYLVIDLDELPLLAARLKFFSVDRFNLFAFHQRDHGDGTPGGLRAWVEHALAQAGLPGGGAVQVHAAPAGPCLQPDHAVLLLSAGRRTGRHDLRSS
jgi:DUF1365 family protein